MGREWKFRTAEQQLAQAHAEHKLLLSGAWEPDKVIARAAVAQAKAQVDQTQTEIERAMVRAPVDCNLLQVTVRPGEYVGTAPGQALMVLGDLERLHVRVDIDEHDISRFHAPQCRRLRFFVRGDGNREIELTFVRVEPYVIPKKSLTGSNTERVDTRACPAGDLCPQDVGVAGVCGTAVGCVRERGGVRACTLWRLMLRYNLILASAAGR